MQIRQENLLNNKINTIKHANVSKFHEYFDKFDKKSSIKIFYFISCGNILYKYFPLSKWKSLIISERS